LTQEEAASLLGVCDRTFCRDLWRYETEGLVRLVDRRLEQVTHRKAPVDKMMALVMQYCRRHGGWAVFRLERTSAANVSSISTISLNVVSLHT